MRHENFSIGQVMPGMRIGIAMVMRLMLAMFGFAFSVAVLVVAMLVVVMMIGLVVVMSLFPVIMIAGRTHFDDVDPFGNGDDFAPEGRCFDKPIHPTLEPQSISEHQLCVADRVRMLWGGVEYVRIAVWPDQGGDRHPLLSDPVDQIAQDAERRYDQQPL